MATYFISYSRKDLRVAEEFRKHLELLDSANEVFLDVHAIKVGENWRHRLARSIERSRYFILLLSKNSNNSAFVRHEIEMVRKSEIYTGLRKLFVFRLDDIPIPRFLAQFQIQSSTGNMVIDFHKLMSGIASGHSYYSVTDRATNNLKYDGYDVEMYVSAPPAFMKLIDRVEYRFDWWFDKGTAGVEGTILKTEKRKKFSIKFWTTEANTIFVTLYLKNTKQIHFTHKVNIG